MGGPRISPAASFKPSWPWSTGISSRSLRRGLSSGVPRRHVARSLCRRDAPSGFVPQRHLRATADVRSAPGGGLGGSQRSPHQGMLTGNGGFVSRGIEARCVWCFRALAAGKRFALPHATIMIHASLGGIQARRPRLTCTRVRGGVCGRAVMPSSYAIRTNQKRKVLKRPRATAV